MRRATLELGARLTDAGRISRPDDMFYLFKPELFEVMESGGEGRWAELAAMIPDRRAYFEHWRERGPSLPTMLGTIPDTVPDPIMIEVFGLSGHFLETLRGGPGGGSGAADAEIRGFPAAKGVAEGVARVITNVTDLHTVQPGEILVCGGTTTEWTPGLRHHPGVRVRHRRLAHARGDRQPRVRHPLRRRHRGGHHDDQNRRSGPGRRPGGNGPGPRVSPAPAGEAVLDLAAIRASDAPRVGPKMARLGQLASAGWRVPDGYAVTAGALEGWLPPAALAELHRLFSAPTAGAAAGRPEFGGHQRLTQLSEQARQLIEGQSLPSWLADAVADAHARLAARTGRGALLRVAVRSSAVGEDGHAASFAGQYETYLGVSGADEVLRHIAKCWASGYSAHALDYRRRFGGSSPLRAHDLAVGVLELVDARSAGVAFTLDPVTGDRGRLVVEANWGLGESVVSGQVTPDYWTVERDSGRILERRVGAKLVWSVLADYRSGRNRQRRRRR